MGRRRNSNQLDPVIRVAPLGELRVYNVTEHELDEMKKGSGDSLKLNLALFLFSAFLCIVTSLFSATFTERPFYVFSFVAVVSAIVGSVLFLMWLQERAGTKALIDTIKARMPPLATQEQSPLLLPLEPASRGDIVNEEEEEEEEEEATEGEAAASAGQVAAVALPPIPSVPPNAN